MPEIAGTPKPPRAEKARVVIEATARPTPEAKTVPPFQIEVSEPAAWFGSFVQAQKGETPRKGFTVGKLELADDVVSDLRTSVQVLGAEQDETTSYTLETKINYSDSRIKKDGGFNPTNQAVKTANYLRQKGIKVKFSTSPQGQQVMLFERDGVRCLVNFGWSSPLEKPRNGKTGNPYDQWSITRLREDLEVPPSPENEIKQNDPIQFTLTDEKGESDVVKAKNQIELGRQTTGYAAMLGDFVEAYYQVRDASPAFNSLTLQIPDWETYLGDDPSVATRSPINMTDFFRAFGHKDNIGILLTPDERATMPSLADIGGQPRAVDEARKLVMAIKNADVFAKRGVDRPKGILVEGPPGTGKTMIAKAIAREAGAEFMSLSVTDLVSMFFGEAEKRVQAFFDGAKALTDQGRDVIAFIDEIDSVVPSREGAHEATQKMVAVFLENMNGLKDNPRLTILAATNQPERIDPAFLRTGRLDKKIKMGLPDATGRAQILDIHLQKHAQRAGDANQFIAPDLDIRMVAEAFGNISGADIAGIVNLALEEKVTAEIRKLEDLEGGMTWSPLTAEDLIATSKKYMQTPKEKPPMGFSGMQRA